jgi:hypothetical protein
MDISRRVQETIKEIQKYRQLPTLAKQVYRRDRAGLSKEDPGIEKVIKLAIEWICLAQDRSATQDGGVAELYSLIRGWAPSYPETTGYIIPTFFAISQSQDYGGITLRANRMLDWLKSIQRPDGGFPGGNISMQPSVSVTFNTGQILLGLASGVRELGDDYRLAMRRAADWLVNTQDNDGCWRKYPSPFVIPGEKSYDAHVAWGMFEAAYLDPDRGYAESAILNIQWVISRQTSNGWMKDCCLRDPQHPLTHTLGYALRGILEAYRFTGDKNYLQPCALMADGLLRAIDESGHLPGRLDENWEAAVTWACLTGSAQIAHCLLLLYQYTKVERYLVSALKLNQYVRRTVYIDGPVEIRGGIKGSFPVSGGYNPYNYINWAAKFFIDSNLLEKEVREANCLHM